MKVNLLMVFSITSNLFSLLLNRQKLESIWELKECLNTKMERGKLLQAFVKTFSQNSTNTLADHVTYRWLYLTEHCVSNM